MKPFEGEKKMNGPYTDERNAQIVLSLLKSHNIKNVVASPGTTNACLIASMQNDGFFRLYSAPEERSAAYIACGLAAQTNEPVILSCTGATASRNYMPGLTEAYYRNLPVLAITSSRRNAFIGHCVEQVTDRTTLPNDVVKISVQMPVVHDEISEWECTINCNKAILSLFGEQRGPAHINLETTYSCESVKSFNPARTIYRFYSGDFWPELNGKIAIIVGSHTKWNDELTNAVDEFCGKYDAIVLCDQTSNYWGKYRVFGCLAAFQDGWTAYFRNIDIAIHIGDVSAAVFGLRAKEVWRVNPEGKLQDTFQKLKNVFATTELDFFKQYNLRIKEGGKKSFFDKCQIEENQLRKELPELPLSNAWVASVTVGKLPPNAVLHLGINNSLRVWNFFDHSKPINGYSNVGGYGIDGPLSSAMGAAIATNEIVYCFLGDLAFFYDMNLLGNRHLPPNLRMVVINNGLGMEMSFNHALAHKIADGLNTDSEAFISAEGHYSNNKPDLIKNYVESLGIQYMIIRSKEEYMKVLPILTSENTMTHPLLIEVLVDKKNETKANAALSSILGAQSAAVKSTIKNMLGDRTVQSLKKLIKN